ncbi:MAG TPA: hypothetical protein VHY84_13790 [Bryobacteraceae bacterium]|jgi:hypothetical protein|nr:hypothetical protein [Bryobacteraceae bacterium]
MNWLPLIQPGLCGPMWSISVEEQFYLGMADHHQTAGTDFRARFFSNLRGGLRWNNLRFGLPNMNALV